MIRTVLASLLLLPLACAGSPPPADVFHRLTLATPAARAAPLLPGTLEVARFQTSDVLRGRAMVVAHAERPGRLQRSRYQFWVDPPPVLLQQALAAQLRASGVASRVVLPELRDDPSFVVVGRVERFERIAGGDAVAVSMELSLRDVADRAVRVQRHYDVSEPADGASPEAAVDAFGRAVARIFSAFVADLEASRS